MYCVIYCKESKTEFRWYRTVPSDDINRVQETALEWRRSGFNAFPVPYDSDIAEMALEPKVNEIPLDILSLDLEIERHRVAIAKLKLQRRELIQNWK